MMISGFINSVDGLAPRFWGHISVQSFVQFCAWSCKIVSRQMDIKWEAVDCTVQKTTATRFSTFFLLTNFDFFVPQTTQVP